MVLFIVFYKKIFAITFDEDFAKTAGIPIKVYGILMASIIATVIVLAMHLVGSLLVSALIIFPSMTAMKLFHGFKMVTIFSAVFSVLGAFLGMAVAIVIGTPVGSTIVTTQFALFLISTLISKIAKKE